MIIECDTLFNFKTSTTTTNKSKSNNLLYLGDIIFNKMDRLHSMSLGDRIKKYKIEEFDNGNNGKIMENKQPLYEISKQLIPFEQHENGKEKVIATNLDIEYLILGSYYNILPITSLLNNLMREKNNFMKNIQFVSNDFQKKRIWRDGCVVKEVKTHSLENRLLYFYVECMGVVFNMNVLQDKRYIKTVKNICQTQGRFSLFAQLSLTGNFDYYVNFVDNILNWKDNKMSMDDNKDKDTDNNTYGMMMNGMLPIIALHLRLDLLKSLKYNCNYCYDINHGLAFLTILFAASPSILNQFKFYSKEKLGIYDNCIFPAADHKNWKLRLNFLYNLCYSSRFHIALKYYCENRKDNNAQQVQYSLGMSGLEQMYNNLDAFVDSWQLKELNLEKQIEIHNSYKSIIQMIFGLNDKLVYFDESSQNLKILDGLVNKNAYHDSFVDMMPQCRDDVFLMNNIVLNARNSNEQQILTELEVPVFDRSEPADRGSSLIGIKFDVVSQLHVFLLDLFELSYIF